MFQYLLVFPTVRGRHHNKPIQIQLTFFLSKIICLIEITLDFDTRGIQDMVWKWLMDQILIHTHMRSMEINVTRVSMILVSRSSIRQIMSE